MAKGSMKKEEAKEDKMPPWMLKKAEKAEPAAHKKQERRAGVK